MSTKCYMSGTCDLTDKPLEKILQPLSDIFTIDIGGQSFDFTILIFWSLIITIIWMRTHRIELVSIVGLLVASGLSASLPEAASKIGYYLIALSVAVLLFKLITTRILSR